MMNIEFMVSESSAYDNPADILERAEQESLDEMEALPSYCSVEHYIQQRLKEKYAQYDLL